MQVYEGTFEEIVARYGERLAHRRVTVTLADQDTASEERPFYATASPEEWAQALREWAANHDGDALPLSDEAIDRDSIYEGRG